MLATLPAFATTVNQRRCTKDNAVTSEFACSVTLQDQSGRRQSDVQGSEQAVPTSVPALSSELLADELCRHFSVGTLCVDSPSRVQAWSDRLEYHLKHSGKVHMVMYYRDMTSVRAVKSRLLFKIRTPLNMFTACYDPLKPDDLLSITFDSQKGLQRFHSILKKAVA